jgi:hypothetical protein
MCYIGTHTKEVKMPTKRIDLVGQKFHKLTVIEFNHTTKKGASYYRCLCDCGVEKVINAKNFKQGQTFSCGCYSKNEKNLRLRSPNPELLTPKLVWKASYRNGCSFEKFLELSQMNCYYCGSPPSNRHNIYSSRMRLKGNVAQDLFEKCWWQYNGLDRIDSSKNHSEDNIVPCCIKCNKAKLDMTTEEFKAWINSIYNYFILSGK